MKRTPWDDDLHFEASADRPDLHAALAQAQARLADLPVQVSFPFGMARAGYAVILFPAACAASGAEVNLPLSAEDEAAVRAAVVVTP